MLIDRCYCYGRTFAELKEVADANGSSSVTDLQAHVDFGLSCHLCHPYVDEMLKTGEVEFDHIIEENPFHRTTS